MVAFALDAELNLRHDRSPNRVETCAFPQMGPGRPGNYLDEVWTIDNRRSFRTGGNLNDGSGSDRLFALNNSQYSVHGLTDEANSLMGFWVLNAFAHAKPRIRVVKIRTGRLQGRHCNGTWTGWDHR